MTIGFGESIRSYQKDERYYVEFDKGQWSKGAAWARLQSKQEVSAEVLEYLDACTELFPENPELKNPWRAAHRCHQWRWYCTPLPRAELAAAAKLVDSEETRTFDPEIWLSTSHKYRMVSRLPEGMTALEALQKYDPEEYQHMLEQLERMAQRHWYRTSAARVEGCTAELTPAEWFRFRKAGGTSA